MPKNIANLKDWTLHQLLKRLEQEVEMYCERAKSWPKLNPIGGEQNGFVPVRRVGTLEEALRESKGVSQIEMVLDLESEDNMNTDVQGAKTVEWRKVEGGKEIPVWKFGPTLRTMTLAPAPSTTTTSANNDNQDRDRVARSEREDPDSLPTSNRFLDSIKSQLDSTISLFDRRLTRETQIPPTGSASSAIASFEKKEEEETVTSHEGEIYVFYSPAHRSVADSDSPRDAPVSGWKEEEATLRIRRDLVDLWISCWRIGLWKGEGWEE
jgi:hypothetical protein